MPLLIGATEEVYLDVGQTHAFSIPQLTQPDGVQVARYPAVVIGAPFARGASINSLSTQEQVAYAFDAVPDANSAAYDAGLGIPIAIPPGAKTLHIYCADTNGLTFVAQFGMPI